MNIKDMLKDDAWKHGLYLDERYEQYSHTLTKNEKTYEPHKKWVEKFSNDLSFLRKRIQADGMDAEDFYRIIKDDHIDYDYTKYDWYKKLVEIFEDTEDEDIYAYLDTFKRKTPFFSFYVPFLNYTLSHMKKHLKMDHSLVYKKTLVQVLENVLDHLFRMSIKALMDHMKNSSLKGVNKKERYQYFVDKKITKKEDILKVLMKYPVLSRMMVETIIKITENRILFMERLTFDQEEIKKHFGIDKIQLKDIIQIHRSDPYSLGTLLLKFENDKYLVYKPKSLHIYEAFDELLQWFNRKRIHRKFKSIKNLDKRSYGWQEYIVYESCIMDKEIKNYYERQGQYLAIMYALNATNMTMDKMIAHSEYPFYVELDTLFDHNIISNKEEACTLARDKALMILKHSILKTKLLPFFDDGISNEKDICGMTGDIDTLVDDIKIENPYTDEMKVVPIKKNVQKFNHLPSIRDKKICAKKYIRCVQRGFYNAYDLMNRHKEEFVKNIYEWFKDAQVAINIRSNSTYLDLLDEALDPKYLQDGIERNWLIDDLWFLLKDQPHKERAIIYEYKDLLHGNLPKFSSVIGCNQLMHHKSVKVDVPIEDPLKMMNEKMNRLCEGDLTRQWKFIEATIQAKYTLKKAEEKKQKRSLPLKNLEKVFPYQDNKIFMKEAIRVGQNIKKMAILGENEASIAFMSLNFDKGENLLFTPTGVGLYNGITGIGLFYLYLFKETGNPEYEKLLNLCVESSFQMMDQKIDENVSVFKGYGSILYLLFHKAMVFEDESLIKQCKKLIDGLNQYDLIHDIKKVTDCTGLIRVCIDFYEMVGYKKALNLAKKLGSYVVDHKKSASVGVKWVEPHEKVLQSVYGNLGIVFTLIKLYDATNDSLYFDTALEGLKYENHMEEEKDLKDSSNHLGKAMSRFGILKYQKDPIVLRKIRKSIDVIMKNGFRGDNHCLYNGAMGNLDLILSVAIHEKDSEYYTFVEKMSTYIMDKVEENGCQFKCGLSHTQKMPGLMLGLAGIGYELLRLSNHTLPCIWLLDPPLKKKLATV